MKGLLGRISLGALAGAGSAALLLGAFGFQYIGGLAPCALCLWQRWPHLAAILLGILSLRIGRIWIALLGAASSATSAGVAIFHAGVEMGYWAGTAACGGTLDIGNLTREAALQAILAAPAASCAEIPWKMAGLSMASWNALFSLALATIWLGHAWDLHRRSAISAIA